MALQVWVHHPDRVWAPCKVKSSRTEDATVVTDDGEILVITAAELQAAQQVQEDQISGVDDICSLAVVNEGTLLHSVRVRYFFKPTPFIYTRVSKILIAINPFCSLPIYDAKHMELYKGDTPSGELPPHIFVIGKDALGGLRDRLFDQAILISGESGAGKTESAKLILSFVADAVKTDVDGGIEGLVLQTNPVLEAFGNAMTARNNNSSRFGKWLDLRFSPELDIMGCALESYLLETTRVCGQASNERGFHVFFQLLQAREQDDLAKLKLLTPKQYKFLQNGRPKADGINDSRNFEELREAMKALGWGQTLQMEIFSILTAILELGNADFKEKGEGAEFTDETSVRRFADLLDIEADTIIHRILHRKITVGKDVTEVPHRLAQAVAYRDALARLVYDRLFLWLIKRMNQTLIIDEKALERRRSSCHSSRKNRARKTLGGQERKLGILDIAGFECFEHNSLEQMLINLSNENLQQHFNQSFLKAEIEDCEREGVAAPQGLDYNDNADCLALFDSRGGILDLLEEEMAVPKASDKSFINKVTQNHAKHPRLIKSKVASDGFGIKHFAGDVKYDATGWLDKNAGSSTTPELAQMFIDSSILIIFELGSSISEEIKEASAGGGRGKKVKSASGGFRISLRSLMKKIGEADPHYVRCVKPNKQKVPDKFTADMVMEQLRFSGVLAAVQIRQQGFAIRTLKDEFLARYRCIADRLASEKKLVKDVETLVDRLPGVMKESGTDVGFKASSLAIGKTKIFQKVEAFEALEVARQRALGSSALTIQRMFRGFWARKQTAIIKELTRQLLKCLARLSRMGGGARARGRTSSWAGDSIMVQLGTKEELLRMATDLQQILAQVEEVQFKNGTVTEAQQLLRRSNLEITALKALLPFAESKDIIGMEGVVARCKALRLPETGDLFKLQKRIKQLKVQLPLVKAMRLALIVKKISVPANVPEFDGDAADDNAPELSEVKAEAEEVGLDKGSEEWLPELGGAELYDKVAKSLEEGPNNEADEERAESNGHTKSPETMEPRMSIGQRMSVRRSVKKLTITGVDPVEQAVIMAGLRRAGDDLDVEELEKLLRRAVEDGLDSVEEANVQEGLAAARTVFEQLQSVDFMVERMDELKEKAREDQPSLSALRQLEQLLLRLRKIPGYEEQCLDGSRALQQAVAKKRVKRKSTKVGFIGLEEEEKVETDLATRIFRNLEEYGRLKPSRQWLGHRRAAFPARKKTVDDFGQLEGDDEKGMLTHSKVVIAEALTVSPAGFHEEEYESGALLNFWNVMVWMNDRPAQDCQRSAARAAILGLANDVPIMRPEVYMQVLKQMIRNPNPRSCILGWELLQSLCKEAPPDNELIEFVKAFIHGGGAELVGSNPAHQLHSKSLAQACLSILERGPGATSNTWDSLWRGVFASITCVACRDRRSVGNMFT